jgi:outer membrane protein OmpA-like peptidoglycan-associated protein
MTTALLSALISTTLAAQTGRGGQVEMGAFGSLTRYDPTVVAAESEFGAGGWLGLYLTRFLSIDGVAGRTQSRLTVGGERLQVVRLGGTLTGHLGTPVGNVYLGAGYARLFYRGIARIDDSGLHAMFGNRISLGGRTAFRLEGRLDFVPSSGLAAASARAVNMSVAAGLSVFAFGGPPRDDDRNLVANKRDTCPGTPAGAVVDERGCPADGDGDAVFDGLDTCPGTAEGAEVDAVGCAIDSDGDSVANGRDICPNTPAGAAVDVNGCPVDGDEDGVFDGIDACPDTPAGAMVDVQGCPLDGDRDGVFDGLDRCPTTSTGTLVDEAGCVLDSDGDGVVDSDDACPDTPEGTEVNALGCRLVRDRDGDGVPDPEDRCPDTVTGENVDATGCPSLFVIEEGLARPLVLEGVSFASARSALTDGSFAVLDRVAASLLANPNVRIEIAGHTDATGSLSVNQRLSLARAQAVKAYLARQGVRPDRMEARGYGPDRPIGDNSTPEGREQNRRVELHLISNP